MSEKTGNTVKLKYDFPSYLCCEVYVPNLGWWHRITPKEFRSWCGQRRMLHLEGSIKQNTSIKAEYSFNWCKHLIVIHTNNNIKLDIIFF